MEAYSTLNDNQLFALLAQGNPTAYKTIYERFTPILYKHAYKFLQDDDEVKDIIQDLFLALWNKREEIHLSGSFSAYLYNATKNRVLDRIAYNSVRSKYENSLQDFLKEGHCVTEQNLREKELKLIIETEIAALPAKMRVIFELRKINYLSHKQISEQLNISDKTVKKQINNAIKILRLKLGLFTVLIFFITT